MTTDLDAEFAVAWATMGSDDPKLRQIAKLFFVAGTIFGIHHADHIDREALRAAVASFQNFDGPH